MNSKTRQATKSTKYTKPSSASTQPSQPIAAGTAPDASQPHLVRIHDLKSFAVIVLPTALRALIGDEAYERQVEDLRNHELVLILREPHDVVYIQVPLMVLSPSTEAQASGEPVKTPVRKAAKSKAKPSTKTTVTSARKPRGKA
ncbi:MAG: hypothetical protein ACREBY_01910 [Polaromonas sp.]